MGVSFDSFIDVIGECYHRSLKSWRADYAPHIAIEDLFANHLRRVRIATDMMPGGVVQVMITVQPRRAAEREIYYWRARRIASVYYIYEH